MIIDMILDRKDDDELLEQGYDSVQYPNGAIRSLVYDPYRFYSNIRDYGKIAFPITAAMDYGTEEDVKKALCDYIINNEYNTRICEYINSRTWLS